MRHLKAHNIVHRDVKLDNVLLANVGTDGEAAVLTDFGMCLDLTKNRIADFRVPMPYDGIRRGGAPIALAPEVTQPKPGPDVFLDYSKNDEWAVGMIGHELMSKEGANPFADMEHPATYSDAGYQNGGISERFQFGDSLGRGDYHHNCSDNNGNEQKKTTDGFAGTHQLAGSVSRMTSW